MSNFSNSLSSETAILRAVVAEEGISSKRKNQSRTKRTQYKKEGGGILARLKVDRDLPKT